MSYYLYIHEFSQLTRQYDQHKTQRELIIINCNNTLDNYSMHNKSPNVRDPEENARLNELIL